MSGEEFQLPRHSLITSRLDVLKARAKHYALVCYRDEPIEIPSRCERLPFSELRNLLTNRPVGASQVTAVVGYAQPRRQQRPAYTMSPSKRRLRRHTSYGSEHRFLLPRSIRSAHGRKLSAVNGMRSVSFRYRFEWETRGKMSAIRPHLLNWPRPSTRVLSAAEAAKIICPLSLQ
jgi:hypothetical protein